MKSYVPKRVPVYVQVLQRASLRMLQPFLDPDRDVLISVEQIRHRLLALSCLCPGASTLIGARTHCAVPETRDTRPGVSALLAFRLPCCMLSVAVVNLRTPVH